MRTRTPVMLIGCLAAVVGYCQEPKTDRNPPPLFSGGSITPLAACKSVPLSLPEDLRRWYSDFCLASNASDRIDALLKISARPPSDMTGLIPLFSELMTTTDSVQMQTPYGKGPRGYIALLAAVSMAEAGTDAVPFAIKALQSKRPLEVRAGLECALNIISVLQRQGKTNELPLVCSNLLSYVAIQITNAVPEKEPDAWIGTIPNAAKQVEQELKLFLPPSPSKDK